MDVESEYKDCIIIGELLIVKIIDFGRGYSIIFFVYLMLRLCINWFLVDGFELWLYR